MSQAKKQSGRLGRYENPYLVAEWHREPPPGTQCTPLQLLTEDRAVAHGWLYARGGERDRRVPDAPARELLAPLPGAGARRGRLRRALHQQPLARQRLDADPRGGAARRRGRAARDPAALSTGSCCSETRAAARSSRFYLSQALAPPGARLRGHRRGRSLRSEPLRAAGGRRDGLPGRASRRGPLPAARDRSLGAATREIRSPAIPPSTSTIRPTDSPSRPRRAASRRRFWRATAPRSARGSKGSTPRRAGASRDAARRGRAGRRPARPRTAASRSPPTSWWSTAPTRTRAASTSRSTRRRAATARSGACGRTSSTTARSASAGSSHRKPGSRPGRALASRAEIEKTGARMTLPCLLVALCRRQRHLPLRSGADRALARHARAGARAGPRRSLRLPVRERARAPPRPPSWSGCER